MLPRPAVQRANRVSRLQRIEEIRFENVYFSYVDRENILRKITFSISAGETIAVVGTTGAGKTVQHTGTGYVHRQPVEQGFAYPVRGRAQTRLIQHLETGTAPASADDADRGSRHNRQRR